MAVRRHIAQARSFIDHSRNVYVRNGYLAIGSDFGWKPPSVTGAVPSAPLTIAEPLAGALVNAYYSGSNGRRRGKSWRRTATARRRLIPLTQVALHVVF